MESIPTIEVSDLPKTWIFDLDGTLLKHNGHIDNQEQILNGVKKFYKDNVFDEDYVLILTARNKKYKKQTLKFLNKNGIRFNKIIFEIPIGERLLFNDIKKTGLLTAYSFNLKRDCGLDKIKFNFIL